MSGTASAGYMLRMAARNALRNRRRSIFTMVALVLGVGIFILARGLVGGIEATMVGLEVDAEHAHLRVVVPAWYEDQDYAPLDIAFDEAADVATALREGFLDAPGVLLRTTFAAEVGDGVRNTPARGVVFDPAIAREVFRLGPLPVPADIGDRPLVWLGASLAAVFDVGVGGEIFLQAKTRHGTRNALDGVVVAGLIDTGHPLVDNFTVFMPRSVARGFLDIDDRFATEVVARFADRDEAEAAEALVAERWPRLMAETWREKTTYIIDLNRIRERVFNVLIGIILLIGASGVANTCLMSGFERTTEIGTMLALGLPRSRVLALFVAESVMIASVGASLGAAVAGSVCEWLSRSGIEFPEISAEAGSVPIPARLFFASDWETLAAGVTLGLLIALVASLYPAWRASHLDPIEALREGA